jgi:glycosyltransferase involved in cell wall biosynthesis
MSKQRIDISVVIPSYRDKFLHNTIGDILRNFTGTFEVIPVIDGYELKKPLIEDPRVKPVVLEANGGMRNAINQGVKASIGKYIMRTDEHCMFAKGFDSEIVSSIKLNWIMTARRYFLDPYAWEVMHKKGYIDYEKLTIKTRKGEEIKFAGVPWYARRRKRIKVKIDETMAMQGSCWVMPRSWWDKVIGELQTEGYGPHYQDSVEMLFKTWKAGGKLMVNKRTWFAHKHRSFNRSHQYSNRKAAPEWKYALDMWRDDYAEIKKKWLAK